MNAEEHQKRGVEYFNQNDFDQAITHFAEALRLDPNVKAVKDDLAVAYYSRGVAYLNKGDSDRAIADITKAISLNPDDIDFYRARGYIYGLSKNHDGVIEDFANAIRLDPNDGSNYFKRGDAYREKGKEARLAGNDDDGSNFLKYTNLAIKDLTNGLGKSFTGENSEQLRELYKKMLDVLIKERDCRKEVYNSDLLKHGKL